MEIAKELKNLQIKGIALDNLGTAYSELGDFNQALDYKIRSFTICQDIGDLQGGANALGSIGNIFIDLEQYSDALECLQPALVIFRELGDNFGEAMVLRGLAGLHDKMQQFDLALEYSNRSCEMASKLGIPQAEEFEEFRDLLLAKYNSLPQLEDD